MERARLGLGPLGQARPDDAAGRRRALRAFDAILLGAVGRPDVPDHVTLWGLLLPIRQRLDQWANVRPVRLLAGVPCPLAGRARGHRHGLRAREHRGRVLRRRRPGAPGPARARSASRRRLHPPGIERVVEHAFELAGERRARHERDQVERPRYGYVLWDEVFAEVAERHPDVRYEHVLVDALAARMVLRPDTLDVVVASNLFGDILTDLGAAIQGSMGMAASANLVPGGACPALFEPVHGSAPDIAGKGIANPCGAVWSAVLMLDHLGEAAASARLFAALADVCREGPRTRDLGGSATTSEVGEAIRARLQAGRSSSPSGRAAARAR